MPRTTEGNTSTMHLFILVLVCLLLSRGSCVVGDFSSHQKRGEINAPSETRFFTPTEPGMPGPVDFDILAKNNLSSYDDEKMSLVSTVLLPGMYQARLPAANGYFGHDLAALGPFFEKDINQTHRNGDVIGGWPLYDDRQTFGTVSGFFDCQPTTPGVNFPELTELGCESVISGVPLGLGISIVVDGHVLNATVDPLSVSNYTRIMDFKNGLHLWSYNWAPKGLNNTTFDIAYTVFASRNRPSAGATKFSVTPRGDGQDVTIIQTIDGRTAVRSTAGSKGLLEDLPTIFVSNSPEGIPYVEAYTFSTVNVSNGFTDETSTRLSSSAVDTDMTIAQEWDASLKDGQQADFYVFLGIASTDGFHDPRSQARNSSLQGYKDGWDTVLSEHAQAWNKLMDRKYMVNYRDPVTEKLPPGQVIFEKLQAEAVASYYSLMSTVLLDDGSGLNDQGVSVGGLASSAYGGMRFWDQDFWIYPAIALVRPDYAKQIVNMRLAQYPQYMRNSQADYVQAYYRFNNQSALIPWATGRFGNATATGPAINYESHLFGVAGLELFIHGAITGNSDEFFREHYPFVKSVGYSVTTLLYKDGSGYSVSNITDPDEYANGITNGAFTLAVFSQLLQCITDYEREHNLPINETWVEMAHNLNIPRAKSGITLEYDGMSSNVSVKQADVILIEYYLRLSNYTFDMSRKDQQFYSQKQNSDGPAMTAGIAAINENKGASSGCAVFSYETDSKLGTNRGPWMQHSELKIDDANANGGVPPAFPFLTGSAGNSMISLQGYLGLNLGSPIMTIRPSLPPPYNHLGIQRFIYAGNQFDATMNTTHTNLTRLPFPTDIPGLVDHFPSSPLPFILERRNTTLGVILKTTHSISTNETVTVENDMYWKQTSTRGNILQCQPTFSTDRVVPGQYAGAATDGNSATRWQPLFRNASTVLIDTHAVRPTAVKALSFEWGARPPMSVRIGFTNLSIEQNPTFQDVDFKISLSVYPDQPHSPSSSSSSSFSNTSHSSSDEIVPYIGNRTTYHFAPPPANYTSSASSTTPIIMTGQTILLEITGCNSCGMVFEGDGSGSGMWRDSDELGATVGEFEVIGKGAERIAEGIRGGTERVTGDERVSGGGGRDSDGEG